MKMILFFIIFTIYGNCQSGDEVEVEINFHEIFSEYDNINPIRVNENNLDIADSKLNNSFIITTFENSTAELRKKLLQENCDFFPGSCDYISEAVNVILFQSKIFQSSDNSSTHTTIINLIFLSVQLVLGILFIISYRKFLTKQTKSVTNPQNIYRPVPLIDSSV